MKGTFFSADFIKDSSENLRLLELNTDTAVLSEEASKIDWSEFINILSTNSITQVDVIYKPTLHYKTVDILSSSLAASASFVTDFVKHPEDLATIYPDAVTDAEDKFILRLAYDEAAVFDSTYCKGRLNTYKLYHSGSNDDYITQFYYSSSIEQYNTLTNEINASNLPDAAIKDIDETFNPIDFHKIGKSSESNSDRWTGFINENKANDKLIEQFHYHSSSLDGDNKLSSYRTFHIVYGSNLDVLNLHSYKVNSILDIPTDISSEVDDTSYSNKLADTHYFEYTTNTFKVDGAGLLSTTKIQMADDTHKALVDISVGESIKSYFISGSPQAEDDYATLNWRHEGAFYPSGSYITSSDVVYKNIEDLNYGGLVEYIVDGDSLFSGTAKQFLVYDSSSNQTQYKHATSLDPDVDYFFDLDGNIIDLDEVNYYITSDTGLKIVELDVEDTDTYIISGSTAFNAVVSHNAPCFIAGTKICMANKEYKNIEDVEINDEVLTYNFAKKDTEVHKVKAIGSKEVSKIVKYTFEDDSILTATIDHPIYCTSCHSWASSDPEFTKSLYNLTTVKVKVGCQIAQSDKSVKNIKSIEIIEEPTLVYNLKSVDKNHNFYANDTLVHNRCFTWNSEVEMFDGSLKPIKEVKVGDTVKSLYKGEIVPGKVTDTLIHPVGEVIERVEYNGIIADPKHPIYYEGEWRLAEDLPFGKVTVDFVSDYFNLEIDGDNEESEHNYFIGGYPASGLGDNKELNNKYKRQPEDLLEHLK